MDENKPPDRLWLQWYGDADPELETGEVSEGDVTWARERVFKHDIEYTRTSLSSTAARSAAEEIVTEIYRNMAINVHNVERIILKHCGEEGKGEK